MSTGLIIAIVAVVLVLLVLLFLLPRMRAQAKERERQRVLERRRGEAVDHHRSEADTKLEEAEQAERRARRERAEAELHAQRAEDVEAGHADDDLLRDEGAGRRGVGPADGARDRDHGDLDRPVGRDRDRDGVADDRETASRRDRDLDRDGVADDTGAVRADRDRDLDSEGETRTYREEGVIDDRGDREVRAREEEVIDRDPERRRPAT